MLIGDTIHEENNIVKVPNEETKRRGDEEAMNLGPPNTNPFVEAGRRI